MPTVTANPDGSYTITVPAPIAVPGAVPGQTVDISAGETVEVVDTTPTV